MLTIGQVAQRSGVAPSALRFYEAEGLIAASGATATSGVTSARCCAAWPSSRPAAPRASRSPRSARRLRACPPTGRRPSATGRELSRAWRSDVEQRIELLERIRDDLASCIGCGCLSLRSCRLFNPVDRAAAAGPGARYLLGDEPARPASVRRR